MKKIAVMISGRLNNNPQFYNCIMDNLISDSNAYIVDFFISYPKDTDTNTINDILQNI